MIEIELKGLNQLLKDISVMPSKLRRNALRSGIHKAASNVAKRARKSTLFQDKRKVLRKSIKAKQRKMRRFEVQSDVYTTAPHGHLIEFGHYIVSGPEGGDQEVLGWVPGQPFMRPAWELHKGDVLRAIEGELWRGILRTARRWARQAERGRLSRSASRALFG